MKFSDYLEQEHRVMPDCIHRQVRRERSLRIWQTVITLAGIAALCVVSYWAGHWAAIPWGQR